MRETIVPEPINSRVQEAGWIPLKFVNEGGGAKVYLCAKVEMFNLVSRLMSTGAVVPNLQVADVGDIVQQLSNHLVRQRDALAVLKIPKSADDPATYERLKREITAMRAVSHPSLIRLFEAESKDPPEWFVMEWHANGDLSRHVAQYEGQAVKTIQAVLPVLEALAALHEKGFVHRDIKPSNIFVSDQGHLVLGDFGIVFPREEERLTELGTTLISRDWVPDWARFTDAPPQPKLDVFMIAKVIYFMVTGGRKVLASQLDEEENNLRHLLKDHEGAAELQELLTDCITIKEPLCKFATAGGLLVRMQDLLNQLNGKVQGNVVFSFLSVHSTTHVPIRKGFISENQRYPSLTRLLIFLPNKCKSLHASARLSGPPRTATFLLFLQCDHRHLTASEGFQFAATPDSDDRGKWVLKFTVNMTVPLNRGWHEFDAVIASESDGYSVTGLVLYSE
jgi:serine/threonine protein kinase